MTILTYILYLLIVTDFVNCNKQNTSSNHLQKMAKKAKPKRCYPISNFTTSNELTSTTLAPTTPFSSPWSSNQDLSIQTSKAILKYDRDLTASEYQAIMDTSNDINTFTQYFNSTQILILAPFIGQTIVSQAACHNSSNLPTNVTYSSDVRQNIIDTFKQNAPNMSPADLEFVVNTLQKMSTICLNCMTYDELNQTAEACISAYINNTLVYGPIETTTVSTSSTLAPTTPFSSPWSSNQDLSIQTSKAILKYGGDLTVSEYQAIMDTANDINTFTQYFNSSQISILTPFIGQTIVSQAARHNTSNLPTDVTYSSDVRQNIIDTFKQNAPNMSPADLEFVVNTLQKMSTICLNCMTYDELNQTAEACISAFINNTLVYGPIETRTVSTSTTLAPTTPFSSPWPSNQELRSQVSQAILNYLPNLTDSEYQELMDLYLDLNTFTQYLNSTQISILVPLGNQIIASQAESHNTSNIPTSITFDTNVKQYISQMLLKYVPNMSPSDIQFVIVTLEKFSTITPKYVALDEVSKVHEYLGNLFINNTLVNGPIETSTVSTLTTLVPTTPFASPWPSNQDLRSQISGSILKYGGDLTVSEYQALMDTSNDINTFAQYWNSTQMSILIPIIGQAIVSQAAIHNTSNLPTTVIYDAEVQQNITQALQEYAPNMSPADIQFVINTLQNMSTIAVNALTLDELTQMAQACASAFITNTMVNGPIETTTVLTSSSSTSTSSLSSSSTTMAPLTTTTLSPVINQQLTSSIKSLAPGLNQTQIQNLLSAIQVLANAYYFTPTQSIIIAPGLSLFFMYHSGSSVAINGTTAVYTPADELNIVTFFNVWVPAMTSSEIQNFITKMEDVSYYSQGVTPLEALSLAPALAQIFINQASTQTAAP